MKPCILWERALNENGYAVVGVKRADGEWRVKRVHRLVCEFFHGPAPDGKTDAMHSCDVRSCYEPSHLSWGTRRDNMQDAKRKNRLAPPMRGEDHARVKLSAKQVLEIRAGEALGVTRRAASERYGVTTVQIGQIVRRENWRHI